MDFWQAIVLGVIEGITEFLPISSTGHLVLAAHVMNIQHTPFVKTFQIVIQLGAIFAVLSIYWKKLIQDMEIWKRILLAFIPTGILGFTFYKFIKGYLIGNDLVVVISLISGGIVLIWADKYSGKFSKIDNPSFLGYGNSFVIGLFQSMAMIPGVSRSGATIIGGMFMGLTRKAAAEFSFLLAIPTMLLATSFDLYNSFGNINNTEWAILVVGFITSFVSALFAVKTLLNFLSKNSFFAFGIYRIVIGLVYANFFLI
ncbi:MAG: undecaprenyl-diphosphate phosphatase [Candidatus Calescibacterium sp.]|nr:undecaprenyl-diphosphate phosphatase [Candidatus Calescibacterium sp.]MDW8133195.1 undecaprenyl-diphosphate phosphatase [Candidatus Calescibacterium sp.]